eukprot:CAMPEP_0174710974 /NCGR_PEP_ID=MMETSP1094-20130205/12432_1 /TAXON_ID=156173 /ORGANISM="Chrysochromulina brevifilum, Strain UTEX LB 985" /LENGTH=58 /DNA_ID=CAMNT_0015909845 /DNA_START=502 /DNA_END=678 /DNA_ORIENTATION=-
MAHNPIVQRRRVVAAALAAAAAWSASLSSSTSRSLVSTPRARATSIADLTPFSSSGIE